MIVAANAARIGGPAEQLVDRHAEDFAANVPQRLVDAGDRRAHDRAGAVKAVDVHGLPVMLDLHRVLADEELAEIVDAGDDGAGLAFERALAPADEALVGFQLDEDVGTVRVGRQGNAEDLHVRDLHAGRNSSHGISGAPRTARTARSRRDLRPEREGVCRRREPSQKITSLHAVASLYRFKRGFVNLDPKPGAVGSARKPSRTVSIGFAAPARRAFAGRVQRGRGTC